MHILGRLEENNQFFNKRTRNWFW